MNIIFMSIGVFLASCISLISGFGLATILTPLFSFFLPLSNVIVLVAVIHWFLDWWFIYWFPYNINWHLFIYFGLTGIVTSAIGSFFLDKIPLQLLSILLGILLVMYAIDELFFGNIKIPYSPITTAIGGIIYGFFSGILGIRGSIRAMFLSSIDISKESFIATTGLIGLCIDTVRLIIYWTQDIPIADNTYKSLLLLVPISFIGSYVGSIILQYISTKTFHILVAIALGIAGFRLILQYY